MAYYNNYSLGALVYSAMHSSYAMIWLMKELTFADKSLKEKVKPQFAILIFLFCESYKIIGFLQISGRGINNPTPLRVFCCVFAYAIGVVVMMVSDI